MPRHEAFSQSRPSKMALPASPDLQRSLMSPMLVASESFAGINMLARQKL